MRRLSFSRKVRCDFAERLAQQFRDQFGGVVETSEYVTHGFVNIEAINTVETKHGQMHLSAQISKTMAHVSRRFCTKPTALLPVGPTFNPYSFKWNDFTCPDYAPTPSDALETFLVNIQAQHTAIIS